jgi:hypothetical protein
MPFAPWSIAAGALVALTATVAASEPPTPPPDPFARICNAFGEGYHLVPGTLTCIKIDGYVKSTISVGSGSTQQPNGPPPQR